MSKDSWINPCGSTLEGEKVHPTALTKEDLLKISDQAELALNKAILFKDKFADEVFHKSFDNVHNDLKTQNLPWLSLLPKAFDEDVPQEHLDALEMEDALLDTYGFLQRAAVGVNQIVQDHKYSPSLLEDFEKAENELKLVLCELSEIISLRNIKMRPDVTKDVMGSSEGELSDSEAKPRDYIIYREYMNTLQYTKMVFKYLSDKVKESE